MKRLLVALAFAVCGVFCLSAQDIITTQDGTDIQAKILEVTTTEVKYKNFSDLEGPTFSILKSDVLIVRYQNGENEVFNKPASNSRSSQYYPTYTTNAEVYPGMRYSEYKDLYNPRDYVRMPSDQSNPFWIGFADFFIPGLGNAINGEWGRAAIFFGGNLGLGLLADTQRTPYKTSYGTEYEYNSLYWVIQVARLGLNVWSIIDAVRVCKVKNMYYQDIYGNRASLDIRVEPFITCTPYTPTGLQPVSGLSCKVNL